MHYFINFAKRQEVVTMKSVSVVQNESGVLRDIPVLFSHPSFYCVV